MKISIFLCLSILCGVSLSANDWPFDFSTAKGNEQIVVEYREWGSWHVSSFRFVFNPCDDGRFNVYDYSIDTEYGRYREDPKFVGTIRLDAGEKEELDKLLELYRKIQNGEIEEGDLVGMYHEDVVFIFKKGTREIDRFHVKHVTAIIVESKLLSFREMAYALKDHKNPNK